MTNCSESNLRSALIGGGLVVLACDSTINLANTLVVAKDIVLDGTGHTTGLCASGTTNVGRLFLVQPGASLTLRNLTLTSGRVVGANGTTATTGLPAYGAAIYNDHGQVILDGCILSNHSVTGGAGANATGSGLNGGAGGQGAGGAIYNDGGQLLVTNSTFTGNSAVGGPGGNSGNDGNGGDGGSGGNGTGAAIRNAGNGRVTIFGSLFLSNNVAGSAAGLGGPGSGVLGPRPGNNGTCGAAVGAAIANESGSVIVVNSTFLANSGT